MAPLTHIFVFGLCAILTECTFHHGIHHGMMGMPMYGSPYMGHGMYPGMGMGMGMHQGGPMMYGMGTGFMPFNEAVDTEAGSTENPENISPEKSESGNPELTKFQEINDPGNARMIRETLEGLNKFTTETVRNLVKREVAVTEDKNSMDLASDMPIVFPNDVDDSTAKLEGLKPNAAAEFSSHPEDLDEATDKTASEKDLLELARNGDYVMIPVVQAVSPVLFDSYANQRDTQTPLAASSQNINQGVAPNLNNYQQSNQNQIPIYGTPMNNINGVGQNYNVLPVNNIGNTPSVLTYLTLPNNMGDQTNSIPNNQYYVNTVPQNIVNRAGLQNSPATYNVAPMNQPQNNLIAFLVQPNTVPLNNQHSNNIPINNQLVMTPINNNPNNVLPVGNNVPANSYILVNSPQNVGQVPNQAGLNVWNVPVVNQPQNFNQQPLDQLPNNISTGNNPNQGGYVPNGYIPVTGQAQPLNVNSNYIPAYYNTKDEVDKNEINS